MPSTRMQLLLVVVVSGLAVVAPLGTATSVGVATDDSTANDARTLEPDETLEDGGEYRVGQTLVSDSWDVDSVELQQRADDSWAFVAELSVTDGRVRVKTDGVDPGRYRLFAEDTNRSVSFRLRASATETTTRTSTTTAEPTTSTSGTELVAGGVYQPGQVLVSDSWSVDTVELQYRTDDAWAFVTELSVTDGTVTVSTDDADTGRYRIVAVGSSRTVSFRLRAPATETTTTETTTTETTSETSTDDPDEPLNDGGTYWVGQTLGDEPWSVDTVELQHKDDGTWVFVSELPVDDDRIRVHTANADPGRYRLVADETSRTVSFRLRAQTLEASVNASTVTDHGSAGATTANVSIRSNRAGYDLAVTSSDVNGSTLATVLGRGEGVDTDGDDAVDAVVLSDVSSDADVSANFRCKAPGNRTLAFTPVDASASANATVTVEAPAVGEVAFVEKALEPSGEGVVHIPVGIKRCAERATVVVGSGDEPVSFVATVNDSDDDGRAVLAWNTSATQTVDAALAAGNGTTVVDATRTRPDDDVPTPAVNGTYALSLYAGNGTDGSELSVAAAMTDADASPEVEIVSVDAPDVADVGEGFQVAVRVENTGSVDAATTVRVVHDGENVTTESLDLAAGANETVFVPLSADETGTNRYRFVAADANATFAVDVVDGTEISTTTTPTETTTTTTTGEPTTTTTAENDTATVTGTGSSGDATGMPGFGVVAALFAVSAIALFARTRR